MNYNLICTVFSHEVHEEPDFEVSMNLKFPIGFLCCKKIMTHQILLDINHAI